MKVHVGKSVLELTECDITEQAADALVNAANAQLVLGGGVAGAIRRKGGPSIQTECDTIGGTPVGTAVITAGGDLKAKHVIHAVGPRHGESNEDEKLRSATFSALELADENKLKSIAFPAISTGIFSFPIQRCAQIMLKAVIEYLTGRTGLQKVIFCLYDQDSLEVFENQLKKELHNKGDGAD